MRSFSMKSIVLAVALTLTLAAPLFAAAPQDRDRTPDRDRRGGIERIVNAVRRIIVGIQELPIIPIP